MFLWFKIHWINSCGHALPHHVDAVLLHVLADLIGHLLVEATQQDGPNHHRHVETKTLRQGWH